MGVIRREEHRFCIWLFSSRQATSEKLFGAMHMMMMMMFPILFLRLESQSGTHPVTLENRTPSRNANRYRTIVVGTIVTSTPNTKKHEIFCCFLIWLASTQEEIGRCHTNKKRTRERSSIASTSLALRPLRQQTSIVSFSYKQNNKQSKSKTI